MSYEKQIKNYIDENKISKRAIRKDAVLCDLGEIKKAKDRFFTYKNNKQIPPEDIIEKIQKIFLIERVDFFKKTISSLQNI